MPWMLSLLEKMKPLEVPLRRYCLPDRFNRVEVETITKCNKACYYCPVSAQPRPAYQMNEELFYSIIDQLAQMRFSGRFSPHFYGEPLLDRRLSQFMAYVRKKMPKVWIVVYTNGDLLTLEKVEELLDAGVNLFLVTFEGEESKIWKQTMEKLPRRRVRRHFIFRIFEKDVKTPFNRGGAVLFPGRELHMKSCYSSAGKFIVDAWGKVKLCSNDYFGTEDWGDLTKESIAEVWAKPEYVKTRRDLLYGKFSKSICRECVGIDKPTRPLIINPMM